MFISRLRTATTETRLTIASLALEQHYRRDQPRVPAGVPEGGQWTNEGDRSGPRSRVAVEGFGRIVFRGIVVRQDYNSQTNMTFCLYFDVRWNYPFGRYWPGRTDFPYGDIH